MRCQDCGSNTGHTYSCNKKKGWFCANQDCIITDSNITKERDEKKRIKEFKKKLKKFKERKNNNEWNGT